MDEHCEIICNIIAKGSLALCMLLFIFFAIPIGILMWPADYDFDEPASQLNYPMALINMAWYGAEYSWIRF